ncbi:2-amino-4-hydroxy-6-hydroxymethyldihydropteridine diphosphokinase [Piscibacillus salipiscarius]|uniref:2-amino-4-hydroxy-6-hydroxymethyldihydropteridine diphosphokinase n=1 Tax=Piscibacillus salipiscarius TaxID=299480 RepID=A0ABW5QCB9_9BACI|nr:2-amino-4-hydroxy-6-hydroxymethyldihydropteridine diphosphokinase [Piscibacillus salipiscarius]
MIDAFIALGTNIEPRENHLYQAIKSLQDHEAIELASQSSIYETDPVGYTDQADFLNMVVHVKVNLSPHELLWVCQSIEQQLGRKRTVRFGPRSIDLDILLFNHQSMETDDLTIPHPRMLERAFVLIPLKEVAPKVKVNGRFVTDWVESLPDDDLAGVRVYNE